MTKTVIIPNLQWQSSGGKARAAKLSPERRSQIASAAATARWSKRHPIPTPEPPPHPADILESTYLAFKPQWNSVPPPSPRTIIDTIKAALLSHYPRD